jgi:cellulose synthase/poly-beta-1,6-N-acetylglucosamine synthase-like glycosyltransferase
LKNKQLIFTKMKTSAIITAFKEQETIEKAIISISNQKIVEEIIVIAPDKETLDISNNLKKKIKELVVLKDPGEGKPFAMNIAVKKAKGDILIFTDGDVYIGKNSLKPLLEKFKDSKVGAVSGNPVSINDKKNLLGFWSFLLTKIADERRRKAIKIGRRFFCSGYFFAIRKSLFPTLKKEILSEDGLISHNVYQKNYKIEYSPKSEVFVKYPTNFSDWIIQKKRSAGGYNQIKLMYKTEIRSFKKESFGAFSFFKYASNIKEIFWIFLLFFVRVYLWFLIYKDINLKKKSHKEIWKRVESTK